jgi:nitrate/nitrite transporter NarK
MTLTMAFAAPALGHVVDRLGPGWIVGPSLLITACAFASLSALTPPVWHLHATYVLIGLASAGTSPVVYSRVVCSWFDRRRGAALAGMIASAGVGAIIHPPAFQALILTAGWRRGCLIWGLVMLVAGVPAVARFVREPQAQRVRAAASMHPISISHALRTRMFWTLLVVMFGTTLALTGVVVHLSALLVDRGVPAGRAAVVMSVMGGASLFGRLLTGLLLDRFDAIRVSCALLVTAAVGVYLLGGATSFAIVLIAVACVGFGTGGEVDVIPYLLSRYFGVQSLATLFGIVWMAFGLAGVAGPRLMGRAFDSTGSYDTVLFALAVGVIMAAALMLTLPAYQSRRADVLSAT